MERHTSPKSFNIEMGYNPVCGYQVAPNISEEDDLANQSESSEIERREMLLK